MNKFRFSIICFKTKPLGISGTDFYGSDVLPVSQPILSKHRRKLKITDSYQQKSPTGLVFYPFTTSLLKDGALLPLCRFSDTNTLLINESQRYTHSTKDCRSGADLRFGGRQPTDDTSHKPNSRLSLLSARPVVTFPD